MLLSNQKTFVQRLDSPLDDRKAWLNSIVQAVTGKTLETFSDEDEILLYEKFKAMILELDSLTKISKMDIDESKEEVIGVKIANNYLGIPLPLLRTRQTHRQGRAIRYNLFFQRTNANAEKRISATIPNANNRLRENLQFEF
jgi:hypothetical protein